MSDLQQTFQKAAVEAKSLPSKPDTDTLLKLYALYKQGSAGDVTGDRPSAMDFVAAAKYDAWKNVEGTDPEAAMQQYIGLVESLKA